MRPQPTIEPPIVSVHQRFTGLGKILAERLFRRLTLQAEDSQKLRDMAQHGTMIYISRNPSHLQYLLLLFVLAWSGLPSPIWAIGIAHWIWLPVSYISGLLHIVRKGVSLRRGLSWVNTQPAINNVIAYQLIKQNQPIMVYIKGPRTILGEEQHRQVPTLLPLLKAQQAKNQPIYLIPSLLFTSHSPDSKQHSLFNRLFGTPNRPSIVRELWQFIWSGKDSLLRFGEATNLQQLMKDHANYSDEDQCTLIYNQLQASFTNEERVVIGPQTSHLEDTVAYALQDKELLELLPADASDNPAVKRNFEQKVTALLKEISAKYRVGYIKFLDKVVAFIVNRMYEGLEVDTHGLKQLAEISRDTPIVICPSHKSHIDYLIVSQLLFHSGITPPHIAAGINLSFWPLGPIFRGCGAFFLRRSFKGNKLYATVFKTYIKYLLHHGFSIEFFMEGGRSRVGKVLPPKLGLLDNIMQGWREGACRDLHFIPVSIDYERLVEVGAYTHELKGGKKKPENISGLIKSRRLLKTRFGRIYLNFSRPIKLSSFIDEYYRNRSSSQYPENDKALTKRLGFKILHEVGNVGTVTPTALLACSILVHRKRALEANQLTNNLKFFHDLLYSLKVRFSPSLINLQAKATDAVLNHLIEQGQVLRESPHHSGAQPILRIQEDARIELDYYKNNVMHHLSGVAIVSNALLQWKQETVAYPAVKDDALFLSRLFKNEFLFEPSRSFMQNFDIALGSLAVHGFLDVPNESEIIIKNMNGLEILAATLDNFIEAYWAVLKGLPELQKFPLWKKEFTLRCLESARRLYLLGETYCVEAINKSLINNAISYFESTDIIRAKDPQAPRDKSPIEICCQEEQLLHLTKQLEKFLPSTRLEKYSTKSLDI